MDLAYIFFTAFGVGLSGAMMPGPLLTVTITESAARGFIAGPLLMLGHALLEGALVFALFFGLGGILTEPLAGRIIAVVGGGFLAWMGLQMGRDIMRGKISPQGTGDRTNLRSGTENEYSSESGALTGMHPVPAGILVSLSNPYWTLWWATVGLSYITMSMQSGTAGIITFFGGHISADLGWYCLVAAGVARGRRFLSPKIFKGIILTCAVFLLALGISFVYYGINLTSRG